MEKRVIEQLKYDLKKAIEEKDIAKIEEISRILNISQEQQEYFKKGLTGFSTIDKPWLKYYRENVESLVDSFPRNKTIWDVIEEKMLEYYDIPAIEYFKTQIRKGDFIDNVYTWARTFRAMGVEEDDVVPVYGPFFPDICAMLFALNVIGACPYFLKLSITPEALAEETKDADIVVVFDAMWPYVAHEFSKDKFKKVLVATGTDALPSPKKEIASFIEAIKSRKNRVRIPDDDKKYISFDKAKEISHYYTGTIKVPFKQNRPAFVTSSSGTTINGIVKGTVATNEAAIAQLYMGKISGIQYFPGDRVLNHFPPTASTSVNSLFLLALYHGEIVVLAPKVSEKDFYDQLVKLKPNIAITTGSAWEAFFNRIAKEMDAGKKFDFSYAKGWTVGGEGTDNRKLKFWNELMRRAHGGENNIIFNGYGLSEAFSAISVEALNARNDFTHPIPNVGIPYAGITIGVFDENGNELPYEMRGELRAKTPAAMKGYYGKPELTKTVKCGDWIRTGDFASIDENGFIYIWGRVKDHIELANNQKLYLFDVANEIKKHEFVSDAIVLQMPTADSKNSLVAHITFDASIKDEDKNSCYALIDDNLKKFLPDGVEIIGYASHDIMLPYSNTTLKKDKNGLAKQTSGYVQVIDDKVVNVEFIVNADGTYTCIKKEPDKIRIQNK